MQRTFFLKMHKTICSGFSLCVVRYGNVVPLLTAKSDKSLYAPENWRFANWVLEILFVFQYTTVFMHLCWGV